MTIAKSESKSPKEKSKPSGVGALIHNLFSLKGTKPDAAQFKKWATMLKPLMVEDENGYRVYTIQQIQATVDFLVENKVDPVLPEHLYYGNLLADVTDKKMGLAMGRVAEILKQQDQLSMYDQKVPSGW